MSVLDNFETITSDESWSRYGWGVDLKDGSTVYRHEVGDTVVWVGELDEDARRFVCEVEVGIELEGQWDGDTPYEALLNGLIDSVIGIAVNEMWHEPMAQGLKYCCEDVVLAAATYGAQVVFYGYERLPQLFPHTTDGVLTTEDELGLYRDLIDAAIGYVRENADRLGIEFEDIWS
jgi:hypothetical protein